MKVKVLIDRNQEMNLLCAIKALRTLSPWGLKEAKDALEQLFAGERPYIEAETTPEKIAAFNFINHKGIKLIQFLEEDVLVLIRRSLEEKEFELVQLLSGWLKERRSFANDYIKGA